MAAYEIISGRDNGTFGGSASITRAQFATLIVNFANLGAGVDLPVVAHPFTDVAADNVHGPNIARLFGAEIINGKSATTFAPSAAISRAEAATVLKQAHEALGVDFSGFTPVSFTDTSGTHAENIGLLAAADVINGTSATTFAPNRNVTRAETASLLKNSADVLSALNLWTADPLPAAPGTTNQTFTVTADETQVPVGTEINVSANVGDAEEVTIRVLDAADVTVTGGDVTFEADADGDFAAGAGTATIIEVDGVAVPADTDRTVTVTDGELDVVLLVGAAGEFVVLVAATEDGAAPELDADGAPLEDFGVTATVVVQDIAGLGIFEAGTDDLVIDALLPEGQDLDVTVALLDAAPGADPSVVAVDGESIDYIIARVANTARCDALQDGSEDPTFAEVVVSTSATTVGGAVTFIVPGGEDGDVHCVLASLDADEDGVYAAFDGVLAFGAPGHGSITYTDAAPIGTTASFVSTDDQFVAVNGTAIVRVEVLDQFGNPASGVAVEFETGFVRTTNASGIASFAFSQAANGLVNVTAGIAAVADVTVTITPAGSVDVYWYDVLEAGDADGQDVDGEILARVSTTEVVVNDTAGFFLVEIESAQLYEVNGDVALQAVFFSTLDDEEEADFSGTANTVLKTTNYDDEGTATTYNLVEATS